MEIKATIKYLRMSPRKVRLVADVIRNAEAHKAQTFLMYSSKRAGEPILKLLNSALANAKKNFSMEKNLFIKKIFVDQGPTYKRFRPAPKGTAHLIKKKTSHVTIILDQKNES